MADESEIIRWIGQLQAGQDGEAQQRLWERYFERLVSLARRKLGGLRAFEDEEDVALSAMNSFFRRISEHQFPQLKDPTELWPLLVKITLCKVADVGRRQYAQKRDVRRNASPQTLGSLASHDYVAEQLLQDCRDLIDSLNDDSLRRVTELKLQGYSNREIAERIQRAEATVEWKLRIIRKILSDGLRP